MKVKDIRELSNEEIYQKEKQFKKELFELNNLKRSGSGSVEKPSRFKLIRKDIARMMTVIKERDQK
jgi:large subunit ribosomal protein L29